MLEGEESIGAQEAADFLGLKKGTIYQMVSRLELPFTKKGNTLSFYPSELREWDEARTVRHTIGGPEHTQTKT